MMMAATCLFGFAFILVGTILRVRAPSPPQDPIVSVDCFPAELRRLVVGCVYEQQWQVTSKIRRMGRLKSGVNFWTLKTLVGSLWDERDAPWLSVAQIRSRLGDIFLTTREGVSTLRTEIENVETTLRQLENDGIVQSIWVVVDGTQ